MYKNICSLTNKKKKKLCANLSQALEQLGWNNQLATYLFKNVWVEQERGQLIFNVLWLEPRRSLF